MKKDFIDFLNTSSPTGYEKEARDWIVNNFKDDKLTIYKDVMGNVIAKTAPCHSQSIMLDGHIDEIGGQVLHINEEGFIIFRRNGGLDKAALISQRVRFLNGIEGVIGKTTLHVEKPSEREKVKEIEDIWIDCGFKNKKEALEFIDIGDYFTFVPNVTELKNDLICSKGIDDKVGAYIAFSVIQKLAHNKKVNYQIFAVGSSQEEIGGYGAKSVAYNINPKICISLDVDFASDIPSSNTNRIGDIKIGEGLIIKRNADTNPVLFDYFKNYCKKHKIKHQISGGSDGGTNASSMKYQRGGIATIDIGIPNRYMHTSNEIVSWKDIEEGIDMLVKIISSIPAEIDLIP